MNRSATLNQYQSTVRINSCPSCQSSDIDVIYRLSGVPVNSVLLLSSQEEARNFATGDIVLGCCHDCGFISNLNFDPGVLEYSARYESTQSYSPTFNKFAKALAKDLVERHNLYGKKIIEIGCGQGEFLKMLCELGENEGLGFDPAYAADQEANEVSNGRGRVQFVAEYYPNQYAHAQADFVCCKMTLEHIHNTGDFVRSLRLSPGLHPDTVIFFQVPNIGRILKDVAFWDIYYEHCSYFSPGSLARLFRRQGFEVLNLWTDYDDQYIMIEARAQEPWPLSSAKPALSLEESVETLAHLAQCFGESTYAEVTGWHDRIMKWQQQGERGVLWGGGSKAVAFLTTLGLYTTDEGNCAIEFVVDVNPNKHGTYLPVTGQQVMSPESLVGYRPDYVIVMNAMYMAEIQRQLTDMGLAPRLFPLH